MIRELINEFRQQNGSPPAAINDWQENQFCLWHCFYMARNENLCHAPEYLRPGKAECCATHSFFKDSYESIREIIFEQFGNSPDHKEIILSSNNLAAAFCVERYQVYVCIRGW